VFLPSSSLSLLHFFLFELQGKTLQTISLLCYLKETEGVSGPSLVVCPLTVLSSWCSELEKWAPSLRFLRLHASNEVVREQQRRLLESDCLAYDVVVTSYEMLLAKNMRSLLQRQHFNYLVLDEGHKIKRHDALVSQASRHIHCENKLLLTGTPLQNNLYELWSLLDFLYPSMFDMRTFVDAFNLKDNHVDETMMIQAQRLLDLFMLRRLKTHVEAKLPPKLETRVYCPMSDVQAFWYKAILLKDLDCLARVSGEGDKADESLAKQRTLLLNLVMQLRKCCQHPFLFDGAETDIEGTSVAELTGSSGKLAVLDMLLTSLFKKNHRTVIFSQFTKVLDILDDYCRMRGWTYCRFDGSTGRAKRTYLVQQFNAESSPYFVILMSTKSGGMGINLQTADTCILYDSDVRDVTTKVGATTISASRVLTLLHTLCFVTVESPERHPGAGPSPPDRTDEACPRVPARHFRKRRGADPPARRA
jgi:SNF2 family DNA or RNA helicase